MSESLLGRLAAGDASRDAIHVAILPVTAGAILYPGQRVITHDGESAHPCSDAAIRATGIVDPFLTHRVEIGERFWLCLFPNTITSLRHDWAHPDIPSRMSDHAAASVPSESAKEASERWLRDFIEGADCPDYDVVIAAATGQALPRGYDDWDDKPRYSIEDYGDGPSLFFGNLDAHGEIPAEFWHHIEVVTGFNAPPAMRAKSFSCSC